MTGRARAAFGAKCCRLRQFAVYILLFAIGGLFVAWSGMGYRVDGVIDPNGPSNPHLGGAIAAAGAWLDNYAAHPWMLLAPILGAVADTTGRRMPWPGRACLAGRPWSTAG